MRILFIGDIVGRPGRKMVFDNLSRLLEEKKIDFTIANGENSSGGFGLTERNFQELIDCGIDAFTMGNHIWDNSDIYNYIGQTPRLVRPANYPATDPGRFWQEFAVQGERLIVTNIVGSIYMAPVYDNPFHVIDALLKQLPGRDEATIFVDFHAEATSEKMAMGWFLDGRISALVGTHTHIQTNDARVLPRGTGYLTDAGMTGPRDSVLGVDKGIIVNRFLTGASPRFVTAAGDVQFNGVIFDIGPDRKARAVETVNFWQPAL